MRGYKVPTASYRREFDIPESTLTNDIEDKFSKSLYQVIRILYSTRSNSLGRTISGKEMYA